LGSVAAVVTMARYSEQRSRHAEAAVSARWLLGAVDVRELFCSAA
jgi:hypothetical protein